MAHVTFEQTFSSEAEFFFSQIISQLVVGFKAEDIRELAQPIRNLEKMYFPEPHFRIGNGGSHVWIHRLSGHIENDPTHSERWGIITEAYAGWTPAPQLGWK